jgi:hypothetical protein
MGLAIGKQSTPFNIANPHFKMSEVGLEREAGCATHPEHLGNPFSSQFIRNAESLTRSKDRQPSNSSGGEAY